MTLHLKELEDQAYATTLDSAVKLGRVQLYGKSLKPGDLPALWECAIIIDEMNGAEITVRSGFRKSVTSAVSAAHVLAVRAVSS